MEERPLAVETHTPTTSNHLQPPQPYMHQADDPGLPVPSSGSAAWHRPAPAGTPSRASKPEPRNPAALHQPSAAVRQNLTSSQDLVTSSQQEQ